MNWRVVGAVVLAVLLVVGVQSWRVHRLKADLQDAKAATLQAQIQAQTNQAGAVINDRRARNTHTAYKQSEEARRAVSEAPDYDSALREFGLGVDRVREAGRASVAEPDGERPDAG